MKKKINKKGNKSVYICTPLALLFLASTAKADTRDGMIGCLVLSLLLFIPLLKKLLSGRKTRTAKRKKPQKTPQRSSESGGIAADPRPVSASAAPKHVAVEPQPVPAPAVQNVPEYCFISFNARGTSYKNEDGEDRQQLLRKLKFHDEPFDGDSADVHLKPYDYTDKKTGEVLPAIRVLVNGYDLGNVPKELVADIMAAMDIPGCKISAIDVLGGGTSRDGEKLNYGLSVVVRYPNPAAS